MRLLTVATASYLDQVLVLLGSLRRHHPELQPTVLLADCSRRGLPPICEALGPDVDVLCCDDLGLGYLDEMRGYYTALEFCSSLKVLGSAHILLNEEQCLFLDPDMVVFGSLREAVLEQPGEVVASCHTFSPYPDDSAAPSDLELCLSGHVNGGVLMTRRGPSGTTALDWLAKKARTEWFVAPHLGMYADQQWLSAVPYFFRERTTIISDRGVNVAYWNLHERPLRKNRSDASISLADAGPLRLMHYSGFPMPPEGRLSKHSSRRFDCETEKILAELVAEYAASLTAARNAVGHLRGDLGFSALSLAQRMQIAAACGGAAHSLPRVGTAQRFRNAARAICDTFRR